MPVIPLNQLNTRNPGLTFYHDGRMWLNEGLTDDGRGLKVVPMTIEGAIGLLGRKLGRFTFRHSLAPLVRFCESLDLLDGRAGELGWGSGLRYLTSISLRPRTWQGRRQETLMTAYTAGQHSRDHLLHDLSVAEAAVKSRDAFIDHVRALLAPQPPPTPEQYRTCHLGDGTLVAVAESQLANFAYSVPATKEEFQSRWKTY